MASMAAVISRRAQASEKALNISEILNEIFSHVSKLRDVYHCALVNQSWYNVAIPIVWRDAPSWDTLIKLENDGMLWKYLPHVRRQYLYHEACKAIHRLDPPTKLHACIARSTVHLRVTSDLALYPVPNLRYLLHPELRILHLCGPSRLLVDDLGELSGLYGMIQQYAPLLQALFVGEVYQHKGYQASDLMTFLYEMPRLINLETESWLDVKAGTEVMLYLAVRQGFERLCLRGDTDFTLDEVLALPGPVFCSLRWLRLSPSREVSHVLPLLRRMTSLESLELSCIDALEIPEILSYCPNLIELEYTFCDEPNSRAPFTAEKLALSLSRVEYPKLRILKLFYDPFTGFPDWHMEDSPWLIHADQFESLANAIPNIELLYLPLIIPADDLFTAELGRKMPHLYNCAFQDVKFAGTSFITPQSPEIGPIFPNLTVLCLGFTDLFRSSESGQSERPHVVQQLCTTCPHLREIGYEGSDDIQRCAMAGLEDTLWEREYRPDPLEVDDLILERIYGPALRNRTLQKRHD